MFGRDRQDATRNAHYAAFHAAKALIFERTGNVQRRHGSVHTCFYNLSRDEPSIDRALRRFLPSANGFKRVTDYDVEVTWCISRADAASVVAEAERLVTDVKALLPRSLPPP